jgi:NADP-dependent alcohol dehydrogenase
MMNFVFHNPVKILFGEGQIAAIAREIPQDATILMTYGGGSIKANGVYDQVMAALSGHKVLEYGGIEPNPSYETLMPAVELARREGVNFLLAVGGGSVLDGTKFIAAAIPFEGDPWDICAKDAPVTSAVAIGAVLTLPATGSEMNFFSVVSRKATQEKLSFGSPKVFPKFSVLDPTVTYSLPPRQIGNGVVDAFVHVMEQYLTYPAGAPLQDRMAESILLTLIEEGPKTYANPQDYASRANMMWCATMALNGLIGVGVPQDWSTHAIGHELTALHGLDHAQTLAVVLPSMMDVQRQAKREKLLQYAERVWGISGTDGDAVIDQAIAKTRVFFESLGVPTRLSGYGVGDAQFAEIVARFERRGETALGERGEVAPATIRQVLTASV